MTRSEQSSIPVDRDLLCGLLGSGGVVGPFDEFAVASNFAPARTSATRWGALTARQRDCGRLDQLVGHGDSGGARSPGPLVILLRFRTVAKVQIRSDL